MDTIPFYFTWKGFKIGTYFPVYVEPTTEKQYDMEGGETINHTLIQVDVPNDPEYVNGLNTLTVNGARYCVVALNKIFDVPPELKTHDEWDLDTQANKADDNFDEMFNS